MDEKSVNNKRREKRIPAELKLEISSLFKQDNVKVCDINAPIEVFDVSKKGIGFYTKSVLPVGYYFNARLELGDDNASLNCVVKIIRSQDNAEKGYIYGCEIIGAAAIMDYIFVEYEDTL